MFSLIEHLKYAGIFWGTFIEGPAVGLIAGFLIKLSYLSLFLGYLAHVAGDFIADCVYYFVGYWGQKKFLKRFNISSRILAKAQNIKENFYRHPRKIIILGKLTHVFGLPVLIGIGLARYPWYKFLLFDIIATLIKSAILIFMGYYLADSWVKANNIISYVGVFGIALIIIISGYFAIKSFKKYLWTS